MHDLVCMRDGGVCDDLAAYLQHVGQLLALGCLHVAHIWAVVHWQREQVPVVK